MANHNKNDENTKLPRRSFLENTASGTLAGAALLGMTNCSATSGQRASQTPISPDVVDEYFDRVSQARASDYHHFVTDFVQNSEEIREDFSDQDREFLDRADDQVRKIIRVLFALAMFHEIDEDQRTDNLVRQRLEPFLAELDEVAVEVCHILDSCPIEEMREISQTLANDPEIVMEIAGEIHRRGLSNGFGRQGQRKLRAVARRITNEIRHQPMAELVDRCIYTVEKTVEPRGCQTPAIHWFTSEDTIEGFWRPFGGDLGRAKAKSEGEQREDSGRQLCYESSQQGLVISPCPVEDMEEESQGATDELQIAYEVSEAEARELREYLDWRYGRYSLRTGQTGGQSRSSSQDRRSRRARGQVIHGGWMTGVGAVLTGMSAGLFLEFMGMSPLMTFGAILMIVGIVILSVGASRRARSRRSQTP